MRRPLPEALRDRMPVDGAPLVVFDGTCVLCSGSARFVLRHDRAARFRLTTAQGELGQAIYRGLGLATDDLGTMLLVADGEVATESDAVLGIGAGLGFPWRPLAALGRIVPAGLRDAVYRLVARNRYRWFGRRETCWMPRPGDAGRIL